MKITKDELQSWAAGQISILFSDGEQHSFAEGLITIVDVHFHGQPDDEDHKDLPGFISQLANHLDAEPLAALIAELQVDLAKKLAYQREREAARTI